MIYCYAMCAKRFILNKKKKTNLWIIKYLYFHIPDLFISTSLEIFKSFPIWSLEILLWFLK